MEVRIVIEEYTTASVAARPTPSGHSLIHLLSHELITTAKLTAGARYSQSYIAPISVS